MRTEIKKLSCWIVTEGHAGSENQCIGLAEAMDLPFTLKRVHPRAPWVWLPVTLWPMPLASLAQGSDPLEPPWPDLLIASGRRSIPFALYVRRKSGGATFMVYIQNPRSAFGRFDAIVAPEHDGIEGPNVITTVGAIHRVTPERVAADASRFADRVARLPRPLVAVLVGGSSRSWRLTGEKVRELAGQLRELATLEKAGLVVTPSRRTGEANIKVLREALAGCPADIWDFTGDNPYFAYLGLADHIVVTGDSVTMISEACSIGKPVYVVELEGGNERFRRFHAAMREGGHTRPFAGKLEDWTPMPLAETPRVAEEIRRRLSARLGD